MEKGLIAIVLLIMASISPALAQVDQIWGRDPFDVGSDMALLFGKIEQDDEKVLCLTWGFGNDLYIKRIYVRKSGSIMDALVVMIIDRSSHVAATRWDDQDGRQHYLNKPQQPGGEIQFRGDQQDRVDEGTAKFMAASILRKYLGWPKGDGI